MTLREHINKMIDVPYTEVQEIQRRKGRYANYRAAKESLLDDIMAAIADAMMSDAAVEAVIDELALGDRYLREAMEARRRHDWSPYSTGAMADGRRYLTAALAAVGVKGQGDGE